MSQFYKLQIQNIQRETSKCVTLSFTVPEELKSVFTFKAGQYITLKTIINNEEIRRDYSLCSSPKSNELKVAVKEVENGTFSKFANNTLKTGDFLEVAPPNGRFVFEPNKDNETIVAFAAGSGITPILSIIKTALQETNSNFVLVYGNKTAKDTIFLDELLALQNNYNDRLNIQFIFSKSKENDALFGRIEKSTVNLIVKNKYKDVIIDAFYLCGPEAMINTVKEVLNENGVNSEKIHFELFTSSTSNDDVNNISNTGETNITVTVDDETETFTMSKKQSVLEATLAEDIDAPYSCQGGVCSSCIARVKEGKTVMRQNNILTDGEVEDGLILTCQAHPVSNTLVVDYDDV